MPEPTLQRTDVNSMSQMLCSVCMPEFMQKEPHTIRPFGAPVPMLGCALAAVQAGAMGNLFDHIKVIIFGIAFAIGKNQI